MTAGNPKKNDAYIAHDRDMLNRLRRAHPVLFDECIIQLIIKPMVETEIEHYIPLTFWYPSKYDLRLAVPFVMIPFGDRFIL
jgi:hypothetical protein